MTVGIPQDPESEEITTLAESLASNLNLTDENEQSVSFNDATEMALPGHNSTDLDGTFSQKIIDDAILRLHLWSRQKSRELPQDNGRAAHIHTGHE